MAQHHRGGLVEVDPRRHVELESPLADVSSFVDRCVEHIWRLSATAGAVATCDEERDG